MKGRVYQLYRYEWDSGEYYIGRTYADSGRLDEAAKYKGQYVYKWMIKPHQAYIEAESLNPFKIGYLESMYTEQGKNDSKCLNAKNETWKTELQATMRYYGEDEWEDFKADFVEYIEWLKLKEESLI